MLVNSGNFKLILTVWSVNSLQALAMFQVTNI